MNTFIIGLAIAYLLKGNSNSTVQPPPEYWQPPHIIDDSLPYYLDANYHNVKPVSFGVGPRPTASPPRPNPYIFNTGRPAVVSRSGRVLSGCNRRSIGNVYPLWTYPDDWHKHLHESCFNNNNCDFL